MSILRLEEVKRIAAILDELDQVKISQHLEKDLGFGYAADTSVIKHALGRDPKNIGISKTFQITQNHAAKWLQSNTLKTIYQDILKELMYAKFMYVKDIRKLKPLIKLINNPSVRVVFCEDQHNVDPYKQFSEKIDQKLQECSVYKFLSTVDNFFIGHVAYEDLVGVSTDLNIIGTAGYCGARTVLPTNSFPYENSYRGTWFELVEKLPQPSDIFQMKKI